MKLKYWLWIGLVGVVSCCFADEFRLPAVAQPGQGAMLRAEQIFPLADKPTPQCHASTIVETKNGLVAAWFGGTKEKNPDVGIWVSRQEEGKWTEPLEVVNGVQSMNLRYACWNPVLFQPKQGPLMLFYKVGPHPREWWGMLTTSEDCGKSWSWPVKLGEDAAIGHLLGPVKNKPVQLADGTIVCPSSTEKQVGEDMLWRAHFEITRDGGKTWEVIGPINDGKTFGIIQPSILTYPGGRMQVTCRSRQKCVAQSWSEDGGKTWSEVSALELPNPNSGTDALTLADGRQLIVYNHTTKGRRILNVAVSKDGNNWAPVVTLENKPRTKPLTKAEFSYPAVIQTADGKVHITYTYIREGVKHVVLNPDEL